MILLEGKPVIPGIKNELIKFFSDDKFRNKYFAVFLLLDEPASVKYVNMKKKFAEDLGLGVKIFGPSNNEHINGIKLDNLENIMQGLNFLNSDDNCIGILFQLPLPDIYKPYKSQILAKIAPMKDVDGMGGVLFGLASIDYIDFIPATPAAVICLLQYYKLDDFMGKTVCILGQSNLIGKPLAMEIIKRGGEVFSFNHFVDKSIIKEICKKSDYIISATGDLMFLDDEYVRDDNTQILIDIGWGVKDGKTAGDINFEKVKDKVYAITPVPGGVGPLTVANIFNNIKIIEEQKDKIIL